ncbi:ATP-binding cassette domain-containing protein [Streptomyces sp. BHT-5-2]|uniref:peptidase domain-containing ABC transporter n=1 Tax=unclassified Streptomyces TaxID=2593676 RepID=UPI001C8E18E0|nr:ABC transporter transmembrane domain-containing protein [Streptomyces sp. BHT-5-2]QZL02172.1 ATP-binding cassette domain-containing protein [Streptomyces sp. BHT-5-2]
MKWQKFHTHQEGESDCGPACARSILRRHGILVDTAILRESIGLGEGGSSLLGLKETLAGYGVDAELLRLRVDELARAVRLAGPAIVLTDDGFRHFVVVHEVTDRGEFVVGDPLFSRVRRVSAEELAAVFTGETLVTDTPATRGPSLRARAKALHAPRLLWDALRENRRALTLILLATIVVSLLALAIGLFVQVAVDTVVQDGSMGALAALCGAFIAVALAAAGLQYGRGRLVVTLSQLLQRRLSNRYTEKLLNLSPAFFRTRRTGDLVSRLDDVQEIQGLVTTTSIGAAIDVFVVLSVGLYLLATNAVLFLFLIPPVIFNALSSYLLFPAIRESAEEALQRDATLKSEAVNLLQGHAELVSYGRRDYARRRLTSLLDRRIDSEKRLGRLENLNSVIKVVNQSVFTIVVTWVALLYVHRGGLTIGQVFSYLTMAGYFLTSMESIASLQITLQRTSAALGRYRDIALQKDDPRLALGGPRSPVPAGPLDLVVDALRVTHPAAPRPAVDGLSLRVPAGRRALIRGSNGSGKSTLLTAVAGLTPGYEGSITLGGAEVSDMAEPTLRRHVLYVPEAPTVLAASVRENLTLGVARPEEEIREACRTARFLQVVDAFPDGLDQPLREGGTGLSRGQLQRLSLARALLLAPRVYLFDESFSGIDRETFREIWADLAALDATKLVVAHGDVRGAEFDLAFCLDEAPSSPPRTDVPEKALT